MNAYPNLENYSQGGSNGKIQPGQFSNGMPEAERGARDIIWAVVFIVHLIGMIVLAVYGIGLLVADNENNNTMQSENPLAQTNLGTKHLAQLGAVVAICAVTGFLLAMLWLWLMRTWPKQLIIATMVIQGALWILLSVYMFVVGAIVGGVIGLIGALITFCFWFFNRHRIPFAAAILATVATVTRRYPGTVGAAVVAIIVQMIWSTLWAFTSLSSAYYVTSSAAGYALYVFFLFSYYWTSEIVRNSGHTTISGTFATWYFQVTNMPSNPTLKSAKRALTTSFGSICLGSLHRRPHPDGARHPALAGARGRGDNIALVRSSSCLIDCLLGCIEGLVPLLQQVRLQRTLAIYGTELLPVVRAKTLGVSSARTASQAIINDSFIGPTLAIGALLGALVNFGVGALVGIAISGRRRPTGDDGRLHLAALRPASALLIGLCRDVGRR
jgi:hypothetical protein